MKNTLFSARNRAIFGLFLCVSILCEFSFAQVAVTPAPFVEPQYFNGTLPCNGCLLYTYAAGTTTPLVTYTDYVGGTPNADPVVMDTNGYPSSSGVKVGVWLAGSAYKLTLKTSAGATIWTVDGVNGLYANFLSLNGGNALTAIADPAASLGKFWLSSTNVGRIKWSDASAIHTIVGADTTDTLTNKTLTSPAITNPSTTGTDSGAETLVNKTLTAPAVTGNMTYASTTPVANLTGQVLLYSSGGSQQTNSHVVSGSCTLGTNCAITLTGAAVFTSAGNYNCMANDTTAANAVAIAYTSGTQFTLTGTGVDVLRYTCIGN